MSYEDTIQKLISGDFDDATPEEREKVIEQIIHASAVASSVLAMSPLPFVEMPIQVTMVRAIGKVYGYTIDKKVVFEILSSIGGSIVLRQLIRFIPGMGAIANISKIYGTTWAMGVAADYYFRQNREVVKEELMRMFKMTQKEKTAEKEKQIEAGHITERLQTLWDLFQKNLITQEEYRRKREEILSQL
jgi:uncharacterized protein (DUF697 family)